jgi:hypothetical protein
MSSAKLELRQIAGKLLQISNKLEGKKEKFEKHKNGGKTKKVDMKERMRLMREMRGKSKTQKMKIMKENNWKGGKDGEETPVKHETVPEPAPAPESETETATVSETEPASESDTEPAPESESEPAPETESEPATEQKNTGGRRKRKDKK